jgi:hypothetical protein
MDMKENHNSQYQNIHSSPEIHFFCLNLAENVNKFMSGLLNAALQIVPDE